MLEFLKSRCSQEVNQFLQLAQKARVPVRALALPTVFAICASLLEGGTLLLLIPTIHGMLARDFSFIYSVPVLGSVAKLVFGDQAGRNFLLGVLLIGLTFAASCLQTMFSYLAALRMTYQVQRFGSELRKLIYSRYLSFGKLFFDRGNLGHLQQILTYNVGVVAGALKTIQGGLGAICTLVVYGVMMFAISWQLAIIVVFAFPLLRMSLAWLIKRINRTSRHYSDSYNELSRKISNALMSMQLVKSYCHEQYEQERFAHLSDKVWSLEYSIEKKGLLVGPIQNLILLAFLFTLVSVIAFWVTHNPAHSIAQYAVFLLILKRAATQFGVFNQILSALASVSGPMRDIFVMFTDEHKFPVQEGARRFEGLQEGISFSNLSFMFPDGIVALKGVSFDICRGELTAIVGATGSGKSTIVNLLMRFYEAPSNSIMIDGVDLRSFTLESWRDKVALVSQDVYLFNDTLRHNLVYGLRREVASEELAQAIERAGLSELVALQPNGLDTLIGDRGVMLSGGERQRVSIARALLKQAEILLLDEATSALDSTTEKVIQDSLERLMIGKTAIVIAHRLSTIRHADKIVVLEQGRVSEVGALKDLLEQRGRFYSYWEDQRVS